MRKMLVLAALSVGILSGCTTVVVRQPACHVKVLPPCSPPPVEYRYEKPPVGPDTGASIYFFRFMW